MWKLFFSDLLYKRTSFIIVYVISIVLGLVNYYLSDADFLYSFMANSIVTYFIVLTIIGTEDAKEKRGRMWVGTPIPLNQVAWFRLLSRLVVFLPMIGLWFLFHFWLDPANGTAGVWTMVTCAAAVFIFVTLFIIQADLGHYGRRVYRWVFGTTVILVFVFLVVSALGFNLFLFTPDVVRFGVYHKLFQTAQGAMIMLPVMAMMLWVSTRVYVNRQHYLA